MGRPKLSLPRADITVVLHLDDLAQQHAYERLKVMKDEGTMQEFLRETIVKSLPKVSETKQKTISKEKPVEVVEDKRVDAPAQPKYRRPAFNPVPKPGSK